MPKYKPYNNFINSRNAAARNTENQTIVTVLTILAPVVRELCNQWLQQ